MKTSKIILKLLYSSSNWLLKLSYIALPLVLFLSIVSFEFLNNLLKSYEEYLIDSYIGMQGRITITTRDRKLIEDIKNYSKEKGYRYSDLKDLKTEVILENREGKLPKFVKFKILKLDYLKYKFNKKDISPHTIFVNDIFVNSLGSIDFHSFNNIYVLNNDKGVKIDNIVRINTGFLTSEPIFFVSDEFGKELFELDKKSQKIYTIEFLETDNKIVNDIKIKVDEFAKNNQTQEYRIKDLLLNTKESAEFFRKVYFLEWGLLSLIVLLSVGTIIIAVNISIEFKKNSLKILHLVGMSISDLSRSIALSISFMFLFIYFISFPFVSFLEEFFLRYSKLPDNFFVSDNYDNLSFIFVIAIFLYLIIYLSTRYIFKKVN